MCFEIANKFKFKIIKVSLGPQVRERKLKVDEKIGLKEVKT
jgi:hypothetical protein